VVLLIERAPNREREEAEKSESSIPKETQQQDSDKTVKSE
jgi:hypothetical protein